MGQVASAIYRISRVWRWWKQPRHAMSRARCGVRLLRLAREPKGRDTGLVLVQIDGLGRKELQRALELREIPFLAELVCRQGFHLTSLYSGLPSTTPAVQGELFYGVRCAVPAYAFYSSGLKRTVEMADADAAAEVESKIAPDRKGLLAGGSACGNIYSGDASEPRLCAAAVGMGQLFGNAGVLQLASFFVLNLDVVASALAGGIAELGRAIGDCVRGPWRWSDIRRAVKVVPSRVVVGVFMRDLSTAAACMDCARGLPVIQLNYLGYDEAAHRFGPQSQQAHQALRGIDVQIRRLWNAANESQSPRYRLIVYSDHGQECVRPYEGVAGTTITDAVMQLYEGTSHSQHPASHCVRAHRSRYLRKRAVTAPLERSALQKEVEVVAIGPIGFIYFREPPTLEWLELFAQRLVAKAHVPTVLMAGLQGVVAWTAKGRSIWPDRVADVVGAEHPFLTQIIADMHALARHPEAGSIVICGWAKGLEPISFVSELGAHGGFGPNETHAFVLSQPGVLDHLQRTLRPDDLRQALVSLQGRAGESTKHSRPRLKDHAFRVATYNVHSCKGMDGRISTRRVARVLEGCQADIIALQELDVHRQRSDFINQAEQIARHLGMTHVFFSARARLKEHFGDAILSKLPMQVMRVANLPGLQGRKLEPRGAVWVACELNGSPVQVVNTHLSLHPKERQLQLNELFGPEWLGHDLCRRHAILCGDLNLTPYSKLWPSIVRRMNSPLLGRSASTWPSYWPFMRLDHILVTHDLYVRRSQTITSEFVRSASDHLPLVADLEFIRTSPHVPLVSPVTHWVDGRLTAGN